MPSTPEEVIMARKMTLELTIGEITAIEAGMVVLRASGESDPAMESVLLKVREAIKADAMDYKAEKRRPC